MANLTENVSWQVKSIFLKLFLRLSSEYLKSEYPSKKFSFSLKPEPVVVAVL